MVFEAIANWRGDLPGSDLAEMALSIVFIFQLCFGWDLFTSVLNGMGRSWEGARLVAFCLVIILLLLQMRLATRFARKILSYKRGVTKNIWAERLGFCTRAERPIAPRRLEKQVAFLTRRFAAHAPAWQLVIWLRQLMLFAIGLIADQTLPSLEFTNRQMFVTLRLLYAAIAMIVTLLVWRYHREWQPYYYRYQNAMEAWLYSSWVALLVLACIYSLLPPYHRAPDTVKAARRIFEYILFIVLLGSMVGAAAFALYKLRETRRQLAEVDLSEFLLSADAKIDEDLATQLASGTIRLLRCSWMVSPALDAALVTDERTGAKCMPRFQALPPEAFFPPKKAKELFKRGDRSVLVLSYGWNRCAPPSDPTGTTLAAVRRYLVYLTRQGANLDDLALFWECVRPLQILREPRARAPFPIWPLTVGSLA